MLCQKCGHLEATVHREETVFRRKIEQHLCAPCAGVGEWAPPPEEQHITFISHTSHMKRHPARPPPPLEYAAKGLLAIAAYVERLYAIEPSFAWLTVHTLKEPVVWIMGGAGSPPHLSPWCADNLPLPVELERSVRDFFTRHGVLPLQVAVPPQISKDVPRVSLYQLPNLPDDATRLVIGLLATCFDVGDHDPLSFQLAHNSSPPA
jgi:hypothetical protein